MTGGVGGFGGGSEKRAGRQAGVGRQSLRLWRLFILMKRFIVKASIIASGSTFHQNK